MSILDDITDKAGLARELYPHGILIGDDVLQVAGMGPEPGKSARVFLENGIVHDFNGSESYDLVTVAKHRWGLDDKDAAALLRVKGYLPQPPSGAEVARLKDVRQNTKAPKPPRDADPMHPSSALHPTSPRTCPLDDFLCAGGLRASTGKYEEGRLPVEAFAQPRHRRDGHHSPLRWPNRSREGSSGGACTALDDPGRRPEGHRGTSA